MSDAWKISLQLNHPLHVTMSIVFNRSKLFLAMAYASIHLLFFLFLFPLFALSQNDGSVSVGSILTANETSSPWLSASSDFAFGFQQIQDKDLFLLSIWYHKLPDKTVVWFVNSSNPVPRGSTVEVDAQTGLVLRDPQGLELWTAGPISNPADHGFLNDTGNFILKGSGNSWLWESFGLPADTILPLQELEIGSVLNSRKAESDFSRGRFFFRFRNDGSLVLSTPPMPNNTGDDIVYYNSQTSDPANTSNSGYRLIFNRRGSISVLKRNNQTVQLGSVSTLPLASENYFRATLDFDGVFTQYYHPRSFTGNPNWTVLWSEPDNICRNIISDKGSGACGYNSICNLVNRRPVCECPNGYSLLDSNDEYGSCMPNSTQSCAKVEHDTAEDLYDFVELNGTDWPNFDYEFINPSTEAGCRQNCLQDCLCAVSIFRDNSCWKKKMPLANGFRDSTRSIKAFLKYRKSDAPPPYPSPEGSKPKHQETLILVGSVLLGSSFFINVLFIAAACLGFYFIYRKKKLKFQQNHDVVGTNLHCFSYKELAEATNGFKNELGRGSFGIVYKGEMQMSSKNCMIAVKKLDTMAHDAEKEFRAEVNTIGKTNQKNLVRLLGFCDEGQNRLLVYEHMSNGTLASFLFCDPKPSWKLRTEIAIGIARGLVYLHEECSTQIIHCDIKPQNILLDDYYTARISDFGLAKLLVLNQSRTLTNIRGTKGYVAPEWFRNTQITAKVDVYSFGVMLLEIVSCQRNVGDIEVGEGSYTVLTDWVWDCFQEGRLDNLVQHDLEALEDRMMLERFVMVGIWCIQEDSSLRPTMRKVSQMLEGIVEVIAPPCPCPFSTC